MSDDTTIEKFLGDYVSGGEWFSSLSSHNGWFPPAGVELKFILGDDDKSAKVIVTVQGDLSDAVKEAIERATYVPKDGKLTAQVGHGSVGILETLRMEGEQQSKTMHHMLQFSDGEVGYWICPSKPKS
ncbi:hypothetical protein HNQ60_002664 [Povalibacter uvarum]|uniref:Uncharacterized protein n=1 Tax=Povalibacter uvarum TaxID=732238 RepID=A0A841HM06_9GAMM|nr:hypothetical protein [Povalibacter uvarum]MBB6093783.1 hypothetical protein [Povalibacter uvarum]